MMSLPQWKMKHNPASLCGKNEHRCNNSDVHFHLLSGILPQAGFCIPENSVSKVCKIRNRVNKIDQAQRVYALPEQQKWLAIHKPGFERGSKPSFLTARETGAELRWQAGFCIPGKTRVLRGVKSGTGVTRFTKLSVHTHCLKHRNDSQSINPVSSAAAALDPALGTPYPHPFLQGIQYLLKSKREKYGTKGE